jgi:uncharacterized membrane protein YfcA
VTPTDIVIIAVAGVLAGLANTVAGGGTLISFPALLATGMPALNANITSSVGLMSGYLGGSIGYRRELRGQRRRVLVLGAVAVLGGIAGAVVLLITPGDSFRVLVPYLVLVSCLLLVVQPRLARLVAVRRAANGDSAGAPEITLAVHIGVFLSAMYGSYFGAGLGVLLLGVLGILIADHLQRLNALKSVLAVLIKVVGTLVFLVSGLVVWWAAGVLFVTAYAGGHLGAWVARRLSVGVLRYVVAALGTAVGISLFWLG